MIRSSHFSPAVERIKLNLMCLFASSSNASSYFYGELLQMILLEHWKTTNTWIHSLFTKHFDLFNEHAGEVCFGMIEGDLNSRKSDKAAFNRRQTAYLLTPTLQKATDFLFTKQSNTARYNNTNDSHNGSIRIQRAVHALRTILCKFLQNTYRPFDPSSFKRYSVTINQLYRSRTAPTRRFGQKLLHKVKQMVSRFLTNLDKCSSNQDLSVALNACATSFSASNYNPFASFDSNYVSEIPSGLELHSEIVQQEAVENFAPNAPLFPE